MATAAAKPAAAKAPPKPAAPAAIQPFAIEDPLVGSVALEHTSEGTALTVNGNILRFAADTGLFQGIDIPEEPQPPAEGEAPFVCPQGRGCSENCYQSGC